MKQFLILTILFLITANIYLITRESDNETSTNASVDNKEAVGFIYRYLMSGKTLGANVYNIKMLPDSTLDIDTEIEGKYLHLNIKIKK